MRNSILKILTVFGLVIYLASQTVYGQEKSNCITLNYILSKLTFTSRIRHSNEEINNQLIKEIQEKKVDFFLTDEREKSIIEARGTDSLIKIIRENSPKSLGEELMIKKELWLKNETKRKEDLEQSLEGLDEKSSFFVETEILYQKFLNYRRSNTIEEIEIAIETGNEFIKKYENDKRLKDLTEEQRDWFKVIIDYVKKQIPKLKTRIRDLSI